MTKRLIDWPDLTPTEVGAVLEAVRSEIDALETNARRRGVMTDEAYRTLDALSDAQVKLRLLARGL